MSRWGNLNHYEQSGTNAKWCMKQKVLVGRHTNFNVYGENARTVLGLSRQGLEARREDTVVNVERRVIGGRTGCIVEYACRRLGACGS